MHGVRGEMHGKPEKNSLCCHDVHNHVAIIQRLPSAPAGARGAVKAVQRFYGDAHDADPECAQGRRCGVEHSLRCGWKAREVLLIELNHARPNQLHCSKLPSLKVGPAIESRTACLPARAACPCCLPSLAACSLHVFACPSPALD